MYMNRQAFMSTASRAIYSINADLLSRFNALFPARERSKIVERMIQKALEERERDLVEAARKIENDPKFAAIREVSYDIDRVAGEALQDL